MGVCVGRCFLVLLFPVFQFCAGPLGLEGLPVVCCLGAAGAAGEASRDDTPTVGDRQELKNAN